MPRGYTAEQLGRSQRAGADVVACLEEAIVAYRAQPYPHPEVRAAMDSLIAAMPTIRAQNERSKLPALATEAGYAGEGPGEAPVRARSFVAELPEGYTRLHAYGEMLIVVGPEVEPLALSVGDDGKAEFTQLPEPTWDEDAL